MTTATIPAVREVGRYQLHASTAGRYRPTDNTANSHWNEGPPCGPLEQEVPGGVDEGGRQQEGEGEKRHCLSSRECTVGSHTLSLRPVHGRSRKEEETDCNHGRDYSIMLLKSTWTGFGEMT